MGRSPVIRQMFGFLNVFGFYNVRFFERVRVLQCSVCSVDFVEKLWESLRETLWEICGKVSTVVCISKFCTFWSEILHKIVVCGGKFYQWFYTRFYLCKMIVLHIFHIVYYYNY